MKINNRPISPDQPPYIIAEMSANHLKEFDRAVKIVEAAKAAGADAVKLQTYTPDSLTIQCKKPDFLIQGSPWQGEQLYDLYKEACMPWDWQPRLKAQADRLGIDLFSTPFDASAVDFLEGMEVPAHKIASFELPDTGLLKKVARTGKPVLLSTGLASLTDIEEAVRTLEENGCSQLALLKCTSAYPARAGDANLHTIAFLADTFGVPAGLSDHTQGTCVPVAAVALGACIVEKHFTLDNREGPDSSFSMTPGAFKQMVQDIRSAHKALGRISFALSEHEKKSVVFRRSLYAVKDICQGEAFTRDNVRSIRPGHGLPPRDLDRIMGKKAGLDIERGTPLSWDLIL